MPKSMPLVAVFLVIGALVAPLHAPAQTFRARTAAGQEIDSDSTRGKVVVLTWWAKWCAPCKKELRDFDAVYQRFRNRGLEVVALDADMDDEGYRFTPPVGRYGIAFAVGFEGNQFPLAGVPTTYILDRRGRQYARFYGRISQSQLERIILPLLISE